MPLDTTMLLGGEAGQGIQSIGATLARAMANGGSRVFADQDYESRVRGGHNFFRIRASDGEVLAVQERLDVLVALNAETVDLHRDELRNGGVVLHDREHTRARLREDEEFNVPMARLAKEAGAEPLAANTVAAGAALGLMDYDFDVLAGALKKAFAGADDMTTETNLSAAQAGFHYARQNGRRMQVNHMQPTGNPSGWMLVNGNEAVALGAMAAGCRFISGYPMTPSTGILELMTGKGGDYGVVAMHVEDEISAINMAVGAGFAGVRSMVATSGGGFSLMVEGLSLAGMTETPVVIVLGQRPGPATGLPTRTEQGELMYAIFAGHGEFPRAVLAPSTVHEAFYAVAQAFNLAEKYQTPVILLTDHHLVTSYASVDRFDVSAIAIDRGALIKEEAATVRDYKRHAVTNSGVSPRALPGLGKELVVTDSDEHDEEGHMIEDGDIRVRLHSKRMRKMEGLKQEIADPVVHRETKADSLLIGWGSSYGAIREAAELLREDGFPVNTLQLSQVWPFPSGAVTAAMKEVKKTMVVESNATGQMARLIRMETGQTADGHILRYDGRPLTPEFIVNGLRKEVS